MATQLFIQRVFVNAAEAPAWAAQTPAISHVAAHGLEFARPVTIITGGNGVGKSTLLEGIARKWGFGVEGGTWGVDKPSSKDALYGALDLLTGPRAKAGYFLRAEAISRVNHFRDRSHGESVLELTSNLIPNALYLFDEPESGLSAIAQMALLAQVHGLAENGAQVIMVTHSPILTAVPEARLLEIDDGGIHERAVEETMAFRAMRDFLADPHGIAEYMAEWAEDEI